MADSNINVGVTVSFKDGGVASGAKSVTQAVEQAAAKATTATERAARRAEQAVEQSTVRQRSSYERMYQDRERVGIRSEQRIQREIRLTEAAYERLARSGTLSFDEQARAAQRMKQRVTELTNEMGRLTTVQKAHGALKFGAAAVAGGAAAAYALSGPAKTAMSYDRRLANMANTAYAERDAAGRKMGMKTLEAAVNKARKDGGGTREQAAEALDTMIASGVVSDSDAIKMLPGIMKAATAADTDAKDLATIAIRAQQSFKIDANDLPKILSAALAAGQAGGFELKDMAKWLPQQMAMAKNLGISGKEGFAKLAAWNQASVITSGTKDEGGNNLRDLLNELNTSHFTKFMADQLYGKASGRGKRDLSAKEVDKLYLDYQSRGIDKVSATMEMAETVFSKDKTYQSLQAKLRATDKKDTAGQREILEAMTQQVQGTAIGKIFHNQQSLMAFLGLMNNQEYTKSVLSKVRNEYTAPDDKSSVNTAYSVVSDTADFKMEQAREDMLVGQKAAMDKLTPAIGKAAETFSDLASKNPLLTGTVVLGATALTSFSGAVGLATLALNRLSGNPGNMPNGGLGGVSKYGKWLGRAGGALTAWELGYDVAGPHVNNAINSIVQWGTGDKDQSLGGWIYDKLHSDNSPLKPSSQPAPKMQADLNIAVTDERVLLKSSRLYGDGVNATVNTGNQWTGAPR